MRFIALTAVLLSTVALCAQAPAPVAAPPAPPAQRYDVPSKPSYVAILTREIKPGESAGRHIHHGVEMTIVIRGDIQLMVQGKPAKVYHAGDSFLVPRDTPHDAKNVGTKPVLIAVTYVIDQGAPMRSPVPEK